MGGTDVFRWVANFRCRNNRRLMMLIMVALASCTADDSTASTEFEENASQMALTSLASPAGAWQEPLTISSTTTSVPAISNTLSPPDNESDSSRVNLCNAQRGAQLDLGELLDLERSDLETHELVCESGFAPRMGHAAVWNGEDLFIYGGYSGTFDAPSLASGLAFNPASNEWRDIAPSPVRLLAWPRLQAQWAEDRLVVVGMIGDGDPFDQSFATHVLMYRPDTDQWTVSAPLPAQHYGIGAMVVADDGVMLVGGGTNAASDEAWRYDLDTDGWQQLQDVPLSVVEGMEGVWDGDEAFFYGGYTVGGNSARGNADPVKYNPRTDQWRTLTGSGEHWIGSHSIRSTGDEFIVFSGHNGPSHSTTLLIYEPQQDQWRHSTPLPIPAGDHMAGDWTGSLLAVWGGFGTYGTGGQEAVSGAGALYEPVTDSWIVMSAAPLTDRCQHSATWIGTGLVVFGGIEVCGDPDIPASADAALYDVESDTWEIVVRGS